MPSAVLEEFDRQLRADVVPTLSAHSFTLSNGQIFRWSIGRFTVNLAVFNQDHLPPSWPIPDVEPQVPDCLSDLVGRLGFFRPPKRSFIDRVLGRNPEPRDHWWRQSKDPRQMRTELAEVTGILLTDGLDWLNARTSLTAFRWALRQLERRKEWRAALGSPGMPRLFTPEPFPQAN